MGGAGLKIAKQFEYSTASEAQNRAEREALSEDCAGPTHTWSLRIQTAEKLERQVSL